VDLEGVRTIETAEDRRELHWVGERVCHAHTASSGPSLEGIPDDGGLERAVPDLVRGIAGIIELLEAAVGLVIVGQFVRRQRGLGRAVAPRAARSRLAPTIQPDECQSCCSAVPALDTVLRDRRLA